eukprot:TRINITY_DN3132_c0_g1_i1.p1 TRINITY_DN3132_c0_g1~~TRINITY_DN3132_c0_g1_i1.p1  ORF type:complete len:223 (-),score=31.65 TRINITY_DN3132_c0_g1_i1:584-1252(-)
MPLPPRRKLSGRRNTPPYSRGTWQSQQSSSTRVTKIRTEEQWEVVMRKSQEKIVLVCFSALFAPCQRMHAFLGDLSKDRIFRDVLFVELNADEFKQQAQEAKVDKVPTCGFYYKGSFLEKVVEPDFKQVYECLKMQVEKFMGVGKGGQQYTWIKWLLGLAVTGGAIAAGTTKLMGRQRSGSNLSSRNDYPLEEFEFTDSEWSDEEGLCYQQYLHGLQNDTTN